MLAIFSDIHLTDSTTSENVHHEAFTSLLGPQIINNAKSNNATEVNIILLGDIFDLVRTDYWLHDDVPMSERPWGGLIDKATGMNSHHMVEGHYKNILNRILDSDSCNGMINMLNKIKEEVNAPVRITYITGNHDRAFNNFTSLQEIVNAKLDKFNTGEIIYTNVFSDERYSALCRHGHEYDDANFGFELYKEMNNDNSIYQFDEKIYKVQSIGEVITTELMAGLIYRLKNDLGENSRFVKMMKDVNNVRPMSKAILWMYWISSNSKLVDKQNQQKLLNAFKISLESLLDTPLAKKWDEIKTDFILWGDITDKLSKLSKIIKFVDFNDLQGFIEVFEFFDNIFASSTDDFEEGARKEFSYKFNDKMQYIFMGHTHEAKQSYFAGNTENFIKLYINTGTYLPFIKQAENGKDFVAAHQMTMAFVYNRDEDYDKGEDKQNKFPTLDLWNGIKKKEYS